MSTIKFYEITDAEPRDPEGRFSTNGGDYWFGRTVAVKDGTPVAVRYWTSAEFQYCPHSGGFYECDHDDCYEPGPMRPEDIAGWEQGELMTGEKAERAMRRYTDGSIYFFHFTQQEATA
jgi:hypothetical protein